MGTNDSAPILSAKNVSQTYSGEYRALHDVSLDIMPGELTLLTGVSGSGKTSLLNILAGLELPTAGSVFHQDIDITALPAEKRTAWRRQFTGVAFQRAGLLDGFTAAQNILAPHKTQSINHSWAGEICARIGLSKVLLGKKPHELSGGQRQRVALGRALVHQPDALLLDEPTASLDTDATAEMHELIRDIVHEVGVTALLVSHETSAIEFVDRIVELKDGAVVSDSGSNKSEHVTTGEPASLFD